MALILVALTGCHAASEALEDLGHHHHHPAHEVEEQKSKDEDAGDKTPTPTAGATPSPHLESPTPEPSVPAGPSVSTSPVPPPISKAAPGAGHVLLLVLENHSFGQIIGSPDAPYLNRLANQYGLAVNYQAVSHPSLPNYLALTGGSAFGITSDCTSCSVSAQNLADQLEARGLTWKAYLDGMPSACFTGASSGEYAKKHNPFLYYTDIASDPTRCQRSIVPLATLSQDIAAGTLPNFSFVAPDQCHDMHSCSVAEGDAWLGSFLPGVLGSPAFQAGGTIFITFDEGTHSDNHVATLVIGPHVRGGGQFAASYDHYSLLRTVEDLFGLDHLGRASAQQTASLADVLPR